MKIGILGGPGKLGLALALRLHSNGHEVTIGSREVNKAAEAAQKLGEGIGWATNAAAGCDAAFVSVPYSGHRSLLEPIKGELHGKIIIDARVLIDPENLLQIKSEPGKSAAEETAAIIAEADVFGAFHTLSHRILRQSDASHDVLVAGGGRRKPDVMGRIRSIKLNPVDAGPIEVAGHLERLTVLLPAINKANKVKESGIKVTGI